MQLQQERAGARVPCKSVSGGGSSSSSSSERWAARWRPTGTRLELVVRCRLPGTCRLCVLVCVCVCVCRTSRPDRERARSWTQQQHPHFTFAHGPNRWRTQMAAARATSALERRRRPSRQSSAAYNSPSETLGLVEAHVALVRWRKQVANDARAKCQPAAPNSNAIRPDQVRKSGR